MPHATIRNGQLVAPGATMPARGDHRRRARNVTDRRNTRHWRRLSASRRRHDNDTCQLCGRHKSELRPNERITVHLARYMNGRHDIATLDDCCTACSTCHGHTDGGESR